MNRRSFFSLLGAATAASLIVPELELLTPKRTFFLPPRGGWQFTNADLLISLDEFIRRVIKPAMIEVANAIDRDAYAFYTGNQWSAFEMANAAQLRQPQQRLIFNTTSY